ncbi:MAG: nucleotidyltransferase family protein [Rhizobiaceae bacterium]
MRPSEALSAHREEALAIISKYPVTNPRVFGSVARGDDTENSDIDIVVDPLETCSYYDLFRIEDAVSRLLNMRVEVHTMAEFSNRMGARVMRDMKSI